MVASPVAGGGVHVHRMKEWLRNNPDVLPAGLHPDRNTSHQLRRGLTGAGWTVEETDAEVRLIPPPSGGPRLPGASEARAEITLQEAINEMIVGLGFGAADVGAPLGLGSSQVNALRGRKPRPSDPPSSVWKPALYRLLRERAVALDTLALRISL